MTSNPAAPASNRELSIDGYPLRVFDGWLPNRVCTFERVATGAAG
jgi:hypothetical protein